MRPRSESSVGSMGGLPRECFLFVFLIFLAIVGMGLAKLYGGS